MVEWRIETIKANHYVSTKGAWTVIDLDVPITNYKFLNFTFSSPDNLLDQYALRCIVPREVFLGTNPTTPIIIVNDLYSNMDAKKVLACYVSSTKMNVYVGSDLYPQNRISVYGIN